MIIVVMTTVKMFLFHILYTEQRVQTKNELSNHDKNVESWDYLGFVRKKRNGKVLEEISWGIRLDVLVKWFYLTYLQYSIYLSFYIIS